MKFLGYQLIKESENEWIYSAITDFEQGTVTVNKSTFNADVTEMPYTFKKVYSKQEVVNHIVNVLKNYPGIDNCAMGSG